MPEPAAAYVEIDGSAPPDVSAHNQIAKASTRTRLVESKIGLVEDIRCLGVRPKRSPDDFSPSFQVCLPYRGLFVWHVGDDEVVADPNQVLFVSAGESFYLSQPLCSEYAALIITPDAAILADLMNVNVTQLSLHPLFRRRSRRSDVGLQLLRARFLQTVMRRDFNLLAAEELLIGLLLLALKADTQGFEASLPTRRLIARAKEFLEANFTDPLRLDDVAQAVGASPAYLTAVFRKVEGVPLHRYLTQLRLARALVELPDVSDITTLALSLGFSSHSHFTVAFRRAFACTPSEFRGVAGNGHSSLPLRRYRRRSAGF
jgi:AraC family transcriptional regulator